MKNDKKYHLDEIQTIVMRVSDSQCQQLNHIILRHSGIWGVADEAVLRKYTKIQAGMVVKKHLDRFESRQQKNVNWKLENILNIGLHTISKNIENLGSKK
jgi:hypothetical protein